MNWQRLLAVGAALVLVALVAALFFLRVAPVQGAIAGGLLGLISSQGALLVQRHLQRIGSVHCKVKAWTGGGAHYAAMGVGGEGEHRRLSVNLFNERNIATTLWYVRVEFYRDEVPWHSVEPVLRDQLSKTVDHLDLPPQTTIQRNLVLTTSPLKVSSSVSSRSRALKAASVFAASYFLR